MKQFWSSPIFRSRYLLAMLAGLVLTAAFPRIGIAGLAWVAPALMLAAAWGKRGAESFRIGYVAALTHYLSMLYWLLLIPYRWHGIPLAPATGWLALSGVLALFPATWVWLVLPRQSPKSKVQSPESQPVSSQLSVVSSNRLEGPATVHATGNTASSALDPRPSLFDPRPSLLPETWLGRTLWALEAAAVWVALEMIMARVLGGFPWDLLGVSQYPLTPLIQVASVTGVYGLSFLVVWGSLALLSAAVMVLRRPASRSVWAGEIVLPVLVVAFLFSFGFRQLRQAPAGARTLRVTLVQPSIPQTLIWDPGASDQRFAELLRLTKRALSRPTDLIIWPESAIPKLIRYDTNTFAAITGLARRHHVWMIVGSDDAEPRPGSTNPEDVYYYNSSFLISPEGKLMQRYIKRNLVIFGEYLPLQNWLPFLKYFTPIQGGFTPGKRAKQFDLSDLGAQTSVLICFEDIFPQLARTDVKPGTDFLVNITNDGWFGHSAAQWQHAVSALFRAVENGVPLIRCSNNGLTCWIDAHGRVRQIFHDNHGAVYGSGFMTIQIPLAPPGEGHELTFYTRHGDWFGWGCMGIAGLVLACRIARTSNLRRKQ